jgi:hypothetical protein
MGKRSDFERRDRDYYPTPWAAVQPLLPHLAPRSTFVEPCAGDGRLIKHLTEAGHDCLWAGDTEPLARGVDQHDALTPLPVSGADYVITNPPWDRKLLHPMIEAFPRVAHTWLLFDADWAHTAQAAPYLRHCAKIVSVGRVKWIEGSKMTGKDNAAWYMFTPDLCRTSFYGRT